MPGRSGRGALRQGLDKDVYQVVTKFIEQEPEDKPLPSATDVWQWIQKSNSSLKRKPKKLLLDSIERVIEAIVEEASDEEIEPVGDFAQDAPSFSNIMNKSIVGSWASSGTATPLVNGDQAHMDENGRSFVIVPHIEGQCAAFSRNQRSGTSLKTTKLVPARTDTIAHVRHHEADSRYCTRSPNNIIAPGT